jgi:hypothetical protein
MQIIPGKNASLDHVVPRNGSKDLSGDISNLVWCDRNVNLMKGSKSAEEFRALCLAIGTYNPTCRVSACGSSRVAGRKQEFSVAKRRSSVFQGRE